MVGLPWLKDYAALTAGGGNVRLAGWSTLRVTGADRQTFLNNFCTNEVKSLAPGQGCEAFFCDVKGKIVAHAIVLVSEEDVLLFGVPGMAARLLPHLDRYVIREDVRFESLSDVTSWSLFIASNLREEPWSQPPAGAYMNLKGVRPMVSCPILWTGGLLVGTPVRAQMFPATITASADAPRDDGDAWHALRIESGWPLFGVDFDESNLPQEVGRDAQAISFRKGCYLGQETVARIDALGHVNKQLTTVRFDPRGAAASAGAPDATTLVPGAELRAADQPAGRVTSATWSPKLGAWLALAMLKRGFHKPGTKVACDDLTGEVIATPAVSRPV